MGRQSVTQTTLQCPECLNKVQICRKAGKQRKRGHIKHMWCAHCQKVVGFSEIKDFDFDENGWLSLDGKVESNAL